jgi:hypothetical protein
VPAVTRDVPSAEDELHSFDAAVVSADLGAKPTANAALPLVSAMPVVKSQ